MPFILRGVALPGMDSVLMVIGPRRKLWARLGDSLRPRHLAEITSDVDLKDFIGPARPGTRRGLLGPRGGAGRRRLLIRQ